ncbi:MAG: glycosyltransferase family 2 protein [Coriobacteriia bacterium]|nr:glycosyltransferase family 2 protein [Coriobacteriia bacterium]
MATYNGERFVGEQIESIQAQTYGNWRLLVSDDCSSDGTLDIVRRYAAEDERIRIVSEGVRYGGAKENFFALMRQTNAAYVMFCDQDDVWREDKIEVEVSAVLDNERGHGSSCPIMVHSDLALIDRDGRALNVTMREIITDADIKTASPEQVLLTSVATGCTMALNRPCIDECLKVGRLGDVVMHDWWATLTACMLGVRVYIDESLVFYRQHENSVVGALGKQASVRAKILNYAAIGIESGLIAIGQNTAHGELGHIRQAQNFYRTHQDRVKAELLEPLVNVCGLPESSFSHRLAILTRHHLWRKEFKRNLRLLLAMVNL